MPSAPLPPEEDAEIKDLTHVIHEAVDAELNELAANLTTTDDAHLFGQNEFRLRAIAHKITAKAVEQHLAEKNLTVPEFGAGGFSDGIRPGRRRSAGSGASRHGSGAR